MACHALQNAMIHMIQIVKLSLQEDIGTGDITANLLPENQQAKAKIISRQQAIICGKEYVNEVYRQLDPNISIEWKINDGDSVVPNQILCEIQGSTRSLLTGERTALNFLQTLSSTATLTKQYVEKLIGTNAKLLDTRKTLPGLREAQKYAVRCGGGNNHRLGLFDAFLIKENHIKAAGSIENAILGAKAINANKFLEIEVRNLDELAEALKYADKIDVIMLDNFSLENAKEAAKITKNKANKANKVKLEISGGITLNNIRDFAETGVDFISVGAITKTVIPIELSMLLE